MQTGFTGTTGGIHVLAEINTDVPSVARFHLWGHEYDTWLDTARLIARIEKAIEAAGLDPAGLAVPAASDDDGLNSSYCARCLCRYQIEAGECPDCAGIALVRMP